MAVTNYKEVFTFPQNGGNPPKPRKGFGNGTPILDPIFEDDTQYPIGSEYTDLDDGKIYTKTSAATWVDSSAA